MSPPSSPPSSPRVLAPVTFSWAGFSHPGKVRKNNEDAFIAFSFDGQETRYLSRIGEAPLANADFVFAVSDGIGGANMGEFASRMAVERVVALLPRSFKLAAGGLDNGFHDLLNEVVWGTHVELLRLGWAYEECAGMGATLTLTWFAPGWMYFAHVGDSRLYYLPKSGGFTQVTHDHSQVGWLRRRGQITEFEARNHPARKSLQQALGANHQFVDPHIGRVGYEPGDRFLLCSDGLSEGLWDARIADLLAADEPAGAISTHLVERAVAESGSDNITAIVIEVAAAP